MSRRSRDPVIDEIREVRHRVSERFAHDPALMVAYYIEQQKEFSDRLIKTKRAKNRGEPAA